MDKAMIATALVCVFSLLVVAVAWSALVAGVAGLIAAAVLAGVAWQGGA